MDKTDYLSECLIRNPAFKKDVLAFHQEFPILLCLADAIEHAPLEAFPPWVQRLREVRSPKLVALIPRTLEQLPSLFEQLWMNLWPACPPCYTVLTPMNGDPYFTALGRPREDYERVKETLFHNWPLVPDYILIVGGIDGQPRRDLFIHPMVEFPSKDEVRAQNQHKRWVQECTRMVSSPSLKILVPIYADTTKEDLLRLWSSIDSAKQRAYPKRRERPDQYVIRLRVWDACQEPYRFADVARHLRMKESTLKSVYAMASRDILGRSDHRTYRQRVTATFGIGSHMGQCFICRKAQNAQGLCEQARAHISQDHVSQRDRPSSHILDKRRFTNLNRTTRHWYTRLVESPHRPVFRRASLYQSLMD